MIDFSQFTLNNQGVTDLGKVLFTTVFMNGDLFKTCKRQTGVVKGSKLDFVDNMGEVGKAGRGCNPSYESTTIKGLEKEWTLGDWSIAKYICYKELENTIAQWCLNTGINKDDVTATEFWNKIYLPLLDRAMNEMFWRMAWFGDTAAKNISSSGIDQTGGGIITDTLDPKLLKACDGLWKRILAIATSGSAQRTTIAANAQSTAATQKSGIKGTGVALGILDNVLADADSLILPNGGRLMMTNSLYQAYRRDYTQHYKATIPFMEVADGVQLPSYDGVPVQVIPEWDNLINKYENDGTKLNNPHRLVFANPDNLLVGTSATSELAEFDTFFAKKERQNYTYAANDLGTLVGEDKLIHVAI